MEPASEAVQPKAAATRNRKNPPDDDLVKKVYSYGLVLLWRPVFTKHGAHREWGPQVCLVKNTPRDTQVPVSQVRWGLPKGRPKSPQETPLDVAVREAEEETGIPRSCIKILDKDDFHDHHYTYEREGVTIQKVVRYYIGLVEHNAPLPWAARDDVCLAEWHNTYSLGLLRPKLDNRIYEIANQAGVAWFNVCQVDRQRPAEGVKALYDPKTASACLKQGASASGSHMAARPASAAPGIRKRDMASAHTGGAPARAALAAHGLAGTSPIGAARAVRHAARGALLAAGKATGGARSPTSFGPATSSSRWRSRSRRGLKQESAGARVERAKAAGRGRSPRRAQGIADCRAQERSGFVVAAATTEEHRVEEKCVERGDERAKAADRALERVVAAARAERAKEAHRALERVVVEARDKRAPGRGVAAAASQPAAAGAVPLQPQSADDGSIQQHRRPPASQLQRPQQRHAPRQPWAMEEFEQQQQGQQSSPDVQPQALSQEQQQQYVQPPATQLPQAPPQPRSLQQHHEPEQQLNKEKEVDFERRRTLALRAVRGNGDLLKGVEESFRSDPEIVLAAVKQSARALMWAPSSLRCNCEFALSAVKANGDALGWICEDLRATPAIACAAVRSRGHALRHVPLQLRESPEILAAALDSAGPAALAHVSALVRRRLLSFLRVYVAG